MRARATLCILVLLVAAVPSRAQKRPKLERRPPMTEVIPLLPYIFFDSASAEIPARYHRFASRAETERFSESALGRNVLVQHRHLLDIIGARMRANPTATIGIVGCGAQRPEIGETLELSRARAEALRAYLAEIWSIDTARIATTWRGLPEQRSNPKSPLGAAENQRAEITSTDWSLLRPVVITGVHDSIDLARVRLIEEHDSTDWSGRLSSSRLGTYWMIRNRFDSPQIGPVNERIVAEEVIPALTPRSRIVALGIIDVDDDWGRALRLSSDRAQWTAKYFTSAKAPHENARGLAFGDLGQQVSSETPEGRFYNRSVIIYVLTPGG